MKLFKLLPTLLALLLCTPLLAQEISQVVRGQVIDQDTKVPLPGANVIIPGSEPLIGTTTDIDGYFRLEEVPVGRVSIEVTFMGYSSTSLANLELSSGKELVLNISLEEKVMTTKEVVVTATRTENRVLNDMTTVSARTFSVEESQRFAGARNDVGRMAANFAGVRGSNDAVNDIVIRGNSPTGLLWRLEGVDIPNPNHFGDGGATGGPVSILNNNVLSNSDFMTAAFPAEYGNALSGVFDLRMRKGNDEKHEFLGQIGFNGFEFGAEGPLKKGSRASYLFNYRYSTVGFMQAIGINVGTGSAVPYFQDASLKLNVPTKKAGNFSLFALGGVSSIDFIESTRDTSDTEDNFYTDAGQDIYSRTRMGVVGLNHFWLHNETTYTRLTLSTSYSLNRNIVDSVSTFDGTSTIDLYRQSFERVNYAANFFINKKLSSRHQFKVGSMVKHLTFNLVDSVFLATSDRFQTLTSVDGSTQLIQPYLQWKFKASDELTFNAGVHADYLTLNDSYRIEPRAGVRWKVANNKSINLGYGLHSQVAPLDLYFSRVEISPGVTLENNRDLGLTGSHHFVVGYDWYFSEHSRLKLETYYQSIFDAVVEVGPSPYSLLNRSGFGNSAPDSVTNGGTGTNYGIELTVERFLDHGWYYLTTLSLYESSYKGSDGIERSTSFDGKYVLNVLGGKEYTLGSNKENSKTVNKLLFDAKVTWAGGQRYTPVDVAASLAQGETVRMEELAFTEQFRDYFRLDLRIAYKRIGKKSDQEWAIDAQNVTNRENPLFQQVSLSDGSISTVNQLGLFPMLQWRMTF